MSDATVREAAQYLLNEVRGCTQVFEWAMRDAISNTNFNSLVRRADALEAALAAVEQPGHVLVPDRLTDEQADAAWEAVRDDKHTYLRKNLSIHSVRLLIREIHRAILARHLAPPAGPTHCFNADDWEVTYEWSDRAELHDGMFCGDVLRVGRLTRLADQWVACVPATFDENGAPDETEMRWFNSFEEANAAANPPLAAAPPPPPSDGEKG